MRENNFTYILELARKQLAAGAEILDINVEGPGLDDEYLLPQVVKRITENIDAPVCIDSLDPDILKAGLRLVVGKPIINSVKGISSHIDQILPIVKDHESAVIGITMDERGIPDESYDRLSIAEFILEQASRIGITEENVLIDPVSMPVATNRRGILTTLEAIKLIKRELNVNVVVSISNVSYGLPDRALINQAFLAMAVIAGATCIIADPGKISNALREVMLIRG